METETCRQRHGDRDMETETWRQRHAETCRQRHADKDMETEACRQRHGDRGMQTKTWRQRHADRDMVKRPGDRENIKYILALPVRLAVFLFPLGLVAAGYLIKWRRAYWLTKRFVCESIPLCEDDGFDPPPNAFSSPWPLHDWQNEDMYEGTSPTVAVSWD
ncbi:hypothetical protein Btru_040554 [Bulinus truncatus]|nr:hypothetical protein Btru_040554 [Bulinus truncatus]